MSSPQQLNFATFDPSFLDAYAGRIINDPSVALVELVANAWDAGAQEVELTWPRDPIGAMVLQDDGTGMTYDEFTRRWPQLSYNRVSHQGAEVTFPDDAQPTVRRAFGRNGKGRHAMFCFADVYEIETWRDGQFSRFVVKRSSGTSPFTVETVDTGQRTGHGTRFSTQVRRNLMSEEDVRLLLGTRFVADPAFRLMVNGQAVELQDLSGVMQTVDVTVLDGLVPVRIFDSQRTGRISKFHGIAWWVNRRLVGQPGWNRLDGAPFVDGRTREGKRYTFVVEADLLEAHVQDDWTGFDDSLEAQDVISRVEHTIASTLEGLLQDVHRARKRQVVQDHRSELEDLPPTARTHIGRFLDEVQRRVPTVTPEVLSTTVEVLAHLESSRSGYGLLRQLSLLPPHDLDALHALLEEWSVTEVRVIVSELDWRLNLIAQLEDVVERKSDELHEIQPLFERGLWIFGPEYEGVSFISNKSLSRVVREFLADADTVVSTPRRRPDIVTSPDRSIEIYARDHHDERGEVDGLDKLVIVELKRGDHEVSRDDLRQAADYAAELRQSGKVGADVPIVCFVLGTTTATNVYEQADGKTNVFPRTYSTVLRQAETRTFDLKRKIEAAVGQTLVDPDIEAVLAQATPLFDEVTP